MGSVFRQKAQRPIPAGAEIVTKNGQRFARWKVRGKPRTAPLVVPTNGKWAGQDRILTESKTFFAKYRDGDGLKQIVPTGCRDEQAARQVLADLERRAELVRSKVITTAQDRISQHQNAPLSEHVTAYLESLRAAETTKVHRENTRRFLERVTEDCGFSHLADLNRETVERWLSDRITKMSARTRNAYRNAAVAFGHWCVANDVYCRTRLPSCRRPTKRPTASANDVRSPKRN